jgi:CubicO group peptidase (beta-lactamase class C family)
MSRVETLKPHWRLILLLTLLAVLTSCSSPAEPPPVPSPTKAAVDYAAIERTVEEKISSGSASLDSIQGVSVSVDGQPVITRYRNGFSSAKTEHMWSVTKSVVATLIGIAMAEGLIENLDQSLSGPNTAR